MSRRNRTPYEAFGTSPDGHNWGAIALRASALPRTKRWRFQPDAMTLIQDQAIGTDQGRKFLYVVSANSDKIVSEFIIKGDGTLKPNGEVSTGDGPLNIAITKKP